MNPSPERRLYDISRPLAAATACWPGDVPCSYRLGLCIRDGASVNVGALETSLHNGTHCDAPYHFDDSGPPVDRLPLDTFVGPARVVDVRPSPDRWAAALAGLDLRVTPRLLFRTDGWPDTGRFPDRIPVMEPGLPAWLARQGVVLVGVDLPSVDPLDSKTLERHHALGRHGIAILEGLWLEDVPEGPYELIAPPLKLPGADASPLRALLRSLPESSGQVSTGKGRSISDAR
jgi:arylformamidase